MSPEVTVLILSFNGKYLLEECLTSYLNNDYPNFKICVIDNGSDDGTQKYVNEKFPNVKVIRTDINLGYSGGFNLGLKYSFDENKSDYTLISNNDIKADSKMISELVKVAETDPLIGFTTGKVYYYNNPDVLQTVGKREHPVRWNGGHIGNQEVDSGQYDEIKERYFADDIFTLVSKKMYYEIGGYDSLFLFQSEEYDWQARAKKAGYKIMYTPGAKIWHKVSMTIGKESAFKAYYESRNPSLVILKHKTAKYFRKYFWLHFRKDIFHSSLVNLKNLRFKTSFFIWKGFFSSLIWGFKNKKFTFKHFI